MNDLVPQDFKPKSFWERPEGVTGQVVGVLLIAGFGLLLYKALPFLITLLQNTIYATVLGVIAIALGFIVTDKRFWRLGSYFYMSLMRKMTQIIVNTDPIGTMKTYVEKLTAKLTDMSVRITKLRGMIQQCKDEIEANDKKRDGSLKSLKVAKAQNKLFDAAFESREVGRLNEATLTYKDLLTKLELLYRVLVKYQEVSTYLIKDMTSEIKLKERKKEVMSAASSVIKSAQDIIMGNPDERAMFDMANEYLAADYAFKVGEIEDFARVSDGFMKSIDLKNGVYEADALDMLTEWEKNADSLVLGDDKRLLIENSPMASLPINHMPNPAKVPVPASSSVVDWFGDQKK